jgi:hypothetical protein
LVRDLILGKGSDTVVVEAGVGVVVKFGVVVELLRLVLTVLMIWVMGNLSGAVAMCFVHFLSSILSLIFVFYSISWLRSHNISREGYGKHSLEV